MEVIVRLASPRGCLRGSAVYGDAGQSRDLPLAIRLAADFQDPLGGGIAVAGIGPAGDVDGGGVAGFGVALQLRDFVVLDLVVLGEAGERRGDVLEVPGDVTGGAEVHARLIGQEVCRVDEILLDDGGDELAGDGACVLAGGDDGGACGEDGGPEEYGGGGGAEAPHAAFAVGEPSHNHAEEHEGDPQGIGVLEDISGEQSDVGRLGHSVVSLPEVPMNPYAALGPPGAAAPR